MQKFLLQLFYSFSLLLCILHYYITESSFNSPDFIRNRSQLKFNGPNFDHFNHLETLFGKYAHKRAKQNSHLFSSFSNFKSTTAARMLILPSPPPPPSLRCSCLWLFRVVCGKSHSQIGQQSCRRTHSLKADNKQESGVEWSGDGKPLKQHATTMTRRTTLRKNICRRFKEQQQHQQ